jgi:hypothetical protein
MAPPAAPAPAPAAPAAPTPKFTWGGLVDTYYMYNFIHGDGQNSLLEVGGSGVVNRAFDTNSNSLTMALAKLSLNASIDPVAFQIDIGYGSTGTIINAANSGYATVPFTGSAPPTGAIPGSFLLEQAFGTISLPGNLTLDFGKFVTTAGAEVIEANKNWLYSRSLLFNIIPLLHTGARLNLKINDMLTVQGSVVNGWNNDPDNNAWKTIGLSATLTLNPMISIIATTYLGKESSAGVTPDGFNALADLVAAFTLRPQPELRLHQCAVHRRDGDDAPGREWGRSSGGRLAHGAVRRERPPQPRRPWRVPAEPLRRRQRQSGGVHGDGRDRRGQELRAPPRAPRRPHRRSGSLQQHEEERVHRHAGRAHLVLERLEQT